jgi:hypothetical protein
MIVGLFPQSDEGDTTMAELTTDCRRCYTTLRDATGSAQLSLAARFNGGLHAGIYKAK